MQRIFTISAIIVVTLIAGCISINELAPPVDEFFIRQVNPSTDETEKLKIGRHLYTGRCGSCHSLDPVNAYNMIEWHKIMFEEKMAKKSKLTDQETTAVLLYIEKATIVLKNTPKK